MPSDLVARLRASPKFAELESRRSVFGWTLTIIMLVIYYGFIAMVAFFQDVMAINIGGVVTLGFPIGLAVIVSAIALTGLYVVRANGEYDRLTREIVEDLR